MIGQRGDQMTRSSLQDPPETKLLTMTRVFLFVLFCAALIAFSKAPATADQSLGIGSKAPALDIEHWLQDGNGFFKHTKEFEEGNVYVVEFWATWCGPCIGSMPHLAELQNKYRGQGVQIISISDESVDEIDALMQQVHPQAGKTFAEVTSAYSLTTDPDRSSQTDYMDAANQQGIPTSFIVGKTGLIEWIGHPMEMDEPLDQIVNDKWDRKGFAKAYAARADFERVMEKLGRLVGASQHDSAIKYVQAEIAKAKKNELSDMVMQYTDILHSLKVSAGKVDEATIEYYRAHIKKIADNPIALSQFGFQLYGVSQQGGKVGPLASDIIEALTARKDAIPPDAGPFVNNTLAQLHVVNGDIEKAIAAQQTAVDAADERQKRRLLPFLNDLKSRLEKEGAEKEEAEK